jgi:copper chaperone CopZ
LTRYEEVDVTSQSYTVTGMPCQHCVNAVSEEVRAIDGVTDARVDLDSGGLTVTSAGPVPDGVVAAAVDEAGYAVAG